MAHRLPTRRRVVEVHTLAEEVRIFEDGALIATHPILEGRHQRPLAFYDAVARVMAKEQRP